MKLITKAVLASVLIVAPVAMANPFLNPFLSPFRPVPVANSVARATNDHRAEARFDDTATLASGKAKYRERFNGTVIQQRFSVQVEDATPGDSLTVLVNGAMFGTIIVNDLGGGELQFRTAEFIDEPGDGDPIPSEFPRIDPGAKISVGGMSSTFR